MKQHLFLALVICSFFWRCTTESISSNSEIIGKWSSETGQFFLNSDGTTEPVTTTIEFFSDQTYTLSTNQINFAIGFLSEPKLPGNWEYNVESKVVRFFQSPDKGINPFDTYYWEIISIFDAKMNVKVFDINEGFLREREFVKID